MLVGCLQPNILKQMMPSLSEGAPVSADPDAAQKTPDLSPASFMLMAPGSHLLGKAF